jgi:diadenosine tetraphosphatase ApaH/serine/threonine PP2A family protein phosphatase
MAWHGSPVSDMQSFTPEPGEDEAELLEGVTDRRLVFGHTHLQFQRPAVRDGIELLNPGSVGIPLDGDRRAAYAVLHDDGTIELRRAEYGWQSVADAVREKIGDLPAKRIEQARFDVS